MILSTYIFAAKVCQTLHIQSKAKMCDELRACRKTHIMLSAGTFLSIRYALTVYCTAVQVESNKLFQ